MDERFLLPIRFLSKQQGRKVCQGVDIRKEVENTMGLEYNSLETDGIFTVCRIGIEIRR